MNTLTRVFSPGIPAAALAVLIGFAMPCFAQDSPAAPAAPAAAAQQPLQVGPTIKKESRLVLVDAVVTDKKGNYIHDLTQNDFKVYEDNKEQPVSSFSTGANAPGPQNSQKHYLVLFFDNSSMALPDQISARAAATKFIASNVAPDNLMAVVEFGGTLRVVQNFTANAELLQAAAKNVKGSYVASNADPGGPGAAIISTPGMGSFSNIETDYGARSMLLSIRTLAKNLRSVPGRKILVLFSSGFPLTAERESELTATIDACNKSNVAVYPLDARGLAAPAPGGATSNRDITRSAPWSVAAGHRQSIHSLRGHLVLAGYLEPQRPGGGGGTGGGTGGGGTGGGRGGTGGTGGTGGGTGGTSGGKGGTGGTGSTGGTTGGTTGRGGTGTGTGTSGGATRGGYPTSNYNANPLNQPRAIIPQIPESTSTNQQILYALADGTGGFPIFNTNDLYGGLQRIAKEQNEFYLLGYVPAESTEGSCHTLKVKMNHGGMNVRARSGYCNVRQPNILDGTPVEKQLEMRAMDAQGGGGVHPSFQSPYFYIGPNVARVNLAMEIPQGMFKFDKDKGKYHSSLSVLGIAYRDDGSVAAKFSDQVKLNLEKDEWKEFTKNPFHYQNQFDAGAGHYKMTVVLSAGSDTYGKSSWPLDIDAYDGKQFALGGIALTNSATPVEQLATQTDFDSVLLEDRTPLVVRGMQVLPNAANRFKKTDRIIMYSEIYDAELTGEKPPRVYMGYKIQERARNKEMFFSGTGAADDFIQKGSPVVPIGMIVMVKDLAPGAYRLVLMAADGAGRQATNRSLDFDITD